MKKQKKTKDGFPEITKTVMLEAYAWMCGIPGCMEKTEHFHHIVPNTEINNKRWPLYMQSPFNCLPICSICHMNKPLPKKPADRLIQLFENYLTSLQASPSKPH